MIYVFFIVNIFCSDTEQMQAEGSPGVQFICMEVSKPNTCVADEKGDFWQRAGRYPAGF